MLPLPILVLWVGFYDLLPLALCVNKGKFCIFKITVENKLNEETTISLSVDLARASC
jgi:hypothetical protein